MVIAKENKLKTLVLTLIVLGIVITPLLWNIRNGVLLLAISESLLFLIISRWKAKSFYKIQFEKDKMLICYYFKNEKKIVRYDQLQKIEKRNLKTHRYQSKRTLFNYSSNYIPIDTSAESEKGVDYVLNYWNTNGFNFSEIKIPQLDSSSKCYIRSS